MSKPGFFLAALLLSAATGCDSWKQEKEEAIGLEFVLIPAGSFLMGSDAGAENERPVHEVVISKPFYLSKHEVTQAQYEALVGFNPAFFPRCGPNCPAEFVPWEEVQLFLHRLNEKERSTAYRLPTEAEWEYACRAGTSTEYAFGDDPAPLGEYAWTGENADKQTHRVGLKRSNPWGLYDMHGNVWEWVQDGIGPYPAGPVEDPLYDDGGAQKVLRGGSWSFSNPASFRCSTRHRDVPDLRIYSYGFRIVKEL